MKYIQKDSILEVHGLADFNIDEILECGQCFRFEKLDEKHYFLIAHGRVLFAKQDEGGVVHFSYENNTLCQDEFEKVWASYFHLEKDYAQIKSIISKDNKPMIEAVNFAPGIRLLAQDPWETIISFIISQNNRIPQIKQVIKNICAAYGNHLGGDNYAFPTPQQLSKATSEDLRALKAGFRDKYIVDATKAAIEGRLNIDRATKATTEELRESLLAVKGIGEKVAHCILLFGYGRFETFPVDVWVRRVMERLYFDDRKISVKEMHDFASKHFGELSGFANQYLFHHIRITEGK